MKGLVIWIKGNTDDEAVLSELGRVISSRGGKTEVFHSETVASLNMEGNEKVKSVACGMIARHGVVVIMSGADSPCISTCDDYEVREISIDELGEDIAHGDFIRTLELAGLVPPPNEDVSPDEAKEILKKLHTLGHL